MWNLNLPVVLSDRVAVLHWAPLSPGLLCLGWVPDALSPDDILDFQGLVVPHDPLSDLSSRGGWNLIMKG